MPSDVTMNQPDARVIRLECQRDEAVGRQEHDIAARGVVQIEGLDRVAALVIRAVLLRQYSEIMAVHVDGMAGRDLGFVFAQSR